MKKLFSILLGVAALGSVAYGQCAYNNVQFGSSSAPTTVGSPTTLTTCIFGGEYRTVTGLTIGSSYTLSTCGDPDFDTQITLYPTGGGSPLGYNDDFCGLQSSLTFTATTTSIDVLVDQYNCVSNSTCMTLTMTLNTGVVYNPCATANLGSIACSTPQTTTFSGTGAGWNVTNCGFSTPGQERVFTFTAPVSGTYTLTVTNGNGWVDYFFKPTSGGCGSTGWTCIDDIFGGLTSVNFTLAAGTYYILADAEGTAPTTHTFSITCAQPGPANDNCSGAIALSCGQTVTGTTVNSNADNSPTCNGFAVGTGGGVWYSVVGTGGPITASMCNAATTYDSKIHIYEGSCTNPVCVTADDDGCVTPGLASEATWCSQAGVTYYILVNGFGAAQGPFSLSISCAPATPNATCTNAATVSCGNSYSGNTSCAGIDTGLPFCSTTGGTAPGVWYTFVGDGNRWTFNTCNAGTDYDTKLHAFTGDNCNITGCVAGNDDIGAACTTGPGTASFKSEISFCTTIGQRYYVLVHGFSTSAGNFTMSVSCTPGPTVSAGPNQIVYTGYSQAPSCATLTAAAAGGAGGYTYLWSTGETTASITVCPTATSDYCVTVTDANGCQGTDCARVCVVDLNCGRNKVLVCHIPPGDPNAAHTICISANAVQTHLNNHGDYLGPCGSNVCLDDNQLARQAAPAPTTFGLTAFPNPFEQTTTVRFNASRDERVTVKVYNMLGAEVATLFDGMMAEGEEQSVTFAPQGVSKGMFMVKMVTASGETMVQRVVMQ